MASFLCDEVFVIAPAIVSNCAAPFAPLILDRTLNLESHQGLVPEIHEVLFALPATLDFNQHREVGP